MTSAPSPEKPASTINWQPVWELAYLFPAQGEWSVEEYLALDTKWMVEFDAGVLEVLHTANEPQPPAELVAADPNLTWEIAYLFPGQGDWSVDEYMDLRPRRQRVRVRPDKFREPDLVFMKTENLARCQEDAWLGADWVMEIISEDSKSRQRDLQRKRADYAGGGIPEYWIVDPLEERITVLRLEGQRYETHGEFKRGEQAASALLAGFSVDVGATLDAGKV